MKLWTVLLVGLVACGGKAHPQPAAVAPTPAPKASIAQEQAAQAAAKPDEDDPSDEPDDAQMMISSELVNQCPQLRLVRYHADEIDPEKLWAVVLVALGDCMQPAGPLGQRSIGVSGGEKHRAVVREVMAHLGISPARVQATASPAGQPNAVAITLLPAVGDQD